MSKIKVKLDGENVWADQTKSGEAIIHNLPYDARVNYKDVVSIDHNNRFIKVIKRELIQGILQYSKPEKPMQEAWKEFVDKVQGEYGIELEGAVAGVAMFGVKVGSDKEEVEKKLKSAGLDVFNILWKPNN